MQAQPAPRQPQPPAPVLYVSVGPPDHGVTRHGRLTAETLRAVVADPEAVSHLPAADAAGFQGLAARMSTVAEAGGIVHLDVTDSLFGPTPAAAADALENLLPAATTVTLHDVPQPAEGQARFEARAEAYARIARHVAGVVVSSEHEQALLAQIAPEVRAHVVPLPVTDRRGEAAVPLPPELAGIEDDVVVFGFLYPGKGHELALDVLTELGEQWGSGGSLRPRRVTALGPVSAGHDALVHELAARAEDRGLEFRVTGFLDDDVADAALRAAGVPLAAHRNVSASGSLNSWISVGRRPIVPAGRYTAEMERLRPGTLRLVDLDGVDPVYAMAEAVAEAVEDPRRTWSDPEADLAPGPDDAARALLAVWAGLERPGGQGRR